MSEGIFIRGFSIEIYPDFYSPNIIPALGVAKEKRKFPPLSFSFSSTSLLYSIFFNLEFLGAATFIFSFLFLCYISNRFPPQKNKKTKTTLSLS